MSEYTNSLPFQRHRSGGQTAPAQPGSAVSNEKRGNPPAGPRALKNGLDGAHCLQALEILVAADDAGKAALARLLHDTLGQHLAAVQLGLSALQRVAELGGSISPDLQRLYSMNQAMAQDLQRISLKLQPTSLDDHGLPEALGPMLQSWSAASGIGAELDCVGLGPGTLEKNINVTLFRIIQSLLEVFRVEGFASRVSIVLRRESDAVTAVIDHDAARPSRSEGGFAQAWSYIQARLLLHAGSVSLETPSGGGRTFFLRLNIPSSP